MAAAADRASPTVGGREAEATVVAMSTVYVSSLSPTQPAAVRMIWACTKVLSELVEEHGVYRHILYHSHIHTQTVLLQQLTEIRTIH